MALTHLQVSIVDYSFVSLSHIVDLKLNVASVHIPMTNTLMTILMHAGKQEPGLGGTSMGLLNYQTI